MHTSHPPKLEVEPTAQPVVPGWSIADAFQQWLSMQVRVAPIVPVFWAPCHWRATSDWRDVSSVEHLAVRISTACHSNDNVCFASTSRGRSGRWAGAIGLVDREVLGWALNLYDGSTYLGDVRRQNYAYDNYDSFSSLSAAQVAWNWTVNGDLAEDLTLRRR